MRKNTFKIMVALAAMVGGAQAQTLSVQPTEAQTGEQTELVVSLTGGTAMTALQFNLQLPEGVILDETAIAKGEAVGEHTLSISTLDGGDRLFVLYSMNLDTFGDGCLLRLPVTAPTEAGTFSGRLYTVRTASVGDGEAVSHTAEDAAFTVTVTADFKEDAVLTTVPAAVVDLVYTGEPLVLVTAGVAEGGEVQYALGADGEFSAALPTATNAGDYEVYYQVVADESHNSLPVTGPVNVTISKAVGSITFEVASVSKTFGDAAFTNPLQNNGDGTVTYASDNEQVATVDAVTGEVTITGSGEANITATVVDGQNYTYATKTATFSIGVSTAAMDIAVEGYTGTYDGEAHGITVTVSVPEGTVVMYGTEEGTYDRDTSPEFTDAGNYTVYYQVTKANYTTVTNSTVVSISKAVGSIGYETTAIEKMDTDAPFTNELTFSGDGTVAYASDNVNVATVNAETGEVTITGIGDATITATVTDGTNYTYTTKTARYTVTVTADTTGINTVAADSDDTDATWYDLNGRRLAGKPAVKGIYVKNGKKVVIR